jgi:hypothetical protein
VTDQQQTDNVRDVNEENFQQPSTTITDEQDEDDDHAIDIEEEEEVDFDEKARNEFQMFTKALDDVPTLDDDDGDENVNEIEPVEDLDPGPYPTAIPNEPSTQQQQHETPSPPEPRSMFFRKRSKVVALTSGCLKQTATCCRTPSPSQVDS